jgi:hypothetical protein
LYTETQAYLAARPALSGYALCSILRRSRQKTNEEKNMKLNNMLLLTCLASVAYCGSTSKRHPDETKRMFVADEPRILVFHDNATGDSSASLAAQGALLSKLGTAKFVPNGAGIPNDIAKKLVESAFANGGKIESSDPLFDITMKGESKSR